ncbi:hypothetical protein BDW72DRAFT_175593 [Aspergillus terricola var. indicus]
MKSSPDPPPLPCQGQCYLDPWNLTRRGWGSRKGDDRLAISVEQIRSPSSHRLLFGF